MAEREEESTLSGVVWSTSSSWRGDVVLTGSSVGLPSPLVLVGNRAVIEVTNTLLGQR